MRHNYIRITKIKRKQKQFSAPRNDIGDHVILSLRSSKDDALDFLRGNCFNGPCSIGFESQITKPVVLHNDFGMEYNGDL